MLNHPRYDQQLSQDMCTRCGAYVAFTDPISAHRHNEFHQQFIHRNEVTQMSRVAWCDPGNHAFKAGTAGSQSGQMTQVNEEGQPVQIQYDCCPEHAFQPTVKTQAEISPVYGVSYRDPNSAPGLE